jgi:hypothetical protein
MDDALASAPLDAVVGRPKDERDTVLKPPPVLGRPEGSGLDASSSSNALRERNMEGRGRKINNSIADCCDFGLQLQFDHMVDRLQKVVVSWGRPSF